MMALKPSPGFMVAGTATPTMRALARERSVVDSSYTEERIC